MATYNKAFPSLDEASTGVTSGALDVSMSDKISIQCLDTASVAGTVTFTVQVSNDGENFVNYDRMVTNIVSGVSGATITTPYYTNRLKLSSAVTSGILFFPDRDHFRLVRVVATKSNQATTSAGTLTATLQALNP